MSQQGNSRDGFQLPTALHCLDKSPTSLGPPRGLCHNPALVFLHPQGGVRCQGLGLPWCSLAALLLTQVMGQALAARPCLGGPMGTPRHSLVQQRQGAATMCPDFNFGFAKVQSKVPSFVLLICRVSSVVYDM